MHALLLKLWFFKIKKRKNCHFECMVNIFWNDSLLQKGWTACYLKSEKRSWKDIWKVLERSQKGPRKIYRKGRWNVSERYWRGPRNYVLREFLGSSQRVVREFPGSQEDPSPGYAWKNDYESHSLVLVAERLQKGCRKVAEGLQNGCRKVAERLRKGYRKVPGRL